MRTKLSLDKGTEPGGAYDVGRLAAWAFWGSTALASCGIHQELRLQRTMDHEVGIMLNRLRVGQIIMNTMRIEGDRREPEQQWRAELK